VQANLEAKRRKFRFNKIFRKVFRAISSKNPMTLAQIMPRNCRLHRLLHISSFGALVLLLGWPAYLNAQTQPVPTQFQLKLSGFENLTGASSTSGTGGGADGSTETEVELTPQYKTNSGTMFAFRGAINLLADSNVTGTNSAWSLAVPELSIFTIGDFGRLEFGDRAGFPQSLIGFTPSEIAFTGAEFGPDSGARLDPNGRLPTLFLPHALASRINGLTYLGYAERFYDDRSVKLIYLTPRSVSGFYGAFSYTPATDISSGFDLASNTRTASGNLRSEGDPGVFRNIVQAAGVWDHRTDVYDLATGLTFSHATAAASTSQGTLSVRDSESLSAGISLTLQDTWTFGFSGTYDGFSSYGNGSRLDSSAVPPYGVVASINYVDGPWVIGGYYQHATADSVTTEPNRDTVDIAELGVSYLIDQNHDLLGVGRYTDLKLYSSVYYYHFRGAQLPPGRSNNDGAAFIIGCRFSFF
jgi:hypothetical protein